MQKPSENAIRVLVVDDDQDMTRLLSFSLRRLGYQVLIAGGAREALQFFRSGMVDVMISDICMPRVSGMELLTELKALKQDLPVVLMMTGYTDVTTEQAVAHGARALFSKPLDLKALNETILSMLAKMPPKSASFSHQFGTNLPAWLEWADGRRRLEGRIQNLSAKSLSMELLPGACPNVCEQIDFRVHCDSDSVPLGGKGFVRWAQLDQNRQGAASINIEFTHLSPAFKERVFGLIKE